VLDGHIVQRPLSTDRDIQENARAARLGDYAQGRKGTPMDDLASRPHGDAHDARPTGKDQTERSRGPYLVVSLVLIALYPFLPPAGRDTVFLVASWTATLCVFVGLRRVGPGKRRVWVLLLVALVVLNIADASAVVLPGDLVVTDTSLPDAAGYLLLLAATLALVKQQRRKNLGSIIDTSIAALALGGVLWDLVLSPNLVAQYQEGPAKLAICVVVFALCGVIGALAQLDIQRPAATALRPLIAAVTLALVGNMVVALTIEPWLTTAAGMLFMGAYTGVGLFGLDPAASEFVTAAPVRADKLSLGRLLFLGTAVAVVPFVVGVRQLAGGGPDALVLVISSVTIAALVMVRIGQLSAQRDEAEQALLHEATHDSLTGLLDRKEFVAGVSDELARDHNIAILYLDLNRFKEINDRCGHANGDKVLIEVAKRLRDSVRADDVVSRFGGDEFVILLRNANPDEVETIKQRIMDALSGPISVSGEPVTVGASVGSALATGDEADPEDLITRADHAMYATKRDETAVGE
jgi:diguanylate cyclase (GGDEF)-like protein